MAETSFEEEKAPPYVSWSTLENLISRFKKDGVPPEIDKSVISNLSGAVQNQLVAGMKFLALIDAERRPTDKLRGLVSQYGSSGWKKAIQVHIAPSYSRILGDLDVSRATREQVETAFRERGGVTGDTLGKAFRFYTAVSQAAEIELSPYLSARQRRSGNSSKPGKRRSAKRQNGGEESGLSRDDPAMIPFVVQIPGLPAASVNVHKDITEEAWDMIDGYVRKYISLRDAKGVKKPSEP